MKSDCYVDAGVRVVRGTNLTGGRSFSGEFVHITLEKAVELNSANLSPNDLVFPHRGAIGEVGIVPFDGNRYVLSSSLMKLTCDVDRANPDFVYYFFKSAVGRFELLKNASQVGTPGIGQPLTSLKQIKFLLPPISEQREISSALRALDDRIALLRETNATLEAIAQALFKSWFVDFDPVRAKSQGLAPAGMDEANAALFPEGFEESALGPIPRGWTVRAVADLREVITNGGTPSRSNAAFWSNGAIPWFKTGEFADGFLVEPSERISEAALVGSSVKVLPEGAILMAIYAAPTVGRLGLLTVPATFNQACTGMVAKPTIGPWFLFETLHFGREWFNSRANGAAQQNISKAIVASYQVIVPPKPLLAVFHEVANGLFARIRLNSEAASNLADLRDTLLPRLISGQLRLPEVLAEMEEAA